MEYIIHYDVAAAIITLTIMLHFFIKKNVNTILTRYYSLLIVTSFIASIFDIIDSYTSSNVDVVPMVIVYLVKDIYLISFNSTAAIYFTYILCVVSDKNAITRWKKVLAFFPFALEVISVLLCPLTGGVFYFDNAGNYYYGPQMYVLYAIALLYVMASLFLAIKDNKKLTITQKGSVYFFTGSSLAAVLIQLMNSNLLVATFAISISVLLIYLSIENPVTFEDRMLGTYNRDAFVKNITDKIDADKKFQIIGVQIDGMKYINKAVGVENGNFLLKEIAEYFMSTGCKVFHISGVKFALLIDGKQLDTDSLIKSIIKRFDKPFVCYGMEILFTALICPFSYPEDVNSIEDVMDTIDYSLKEIATTGNSLIINANDEILKRKRRENDIIQIMKKAVNEKAFDVYYQPIYSVSDRKFTSAEALVRLKSDSIGFISPEEFIPLAEQHGLILQIGEIVFDKVCRFITLNRPERQGIQYIEVNLSVVQCMQNKLYEKLLQITDSYGVNHSMINFEITETAATVSNEILINNMKELMEAGISFSMDDYGTGFSNTSQVIEYPFSIVKFDKSMIWSAMTSDKAMCALKYNMAMIKAMKMHIVAEGVETAEQAEILEKMGCDYFQGYYYSRPVPETEFLKLIS